MKIGGLTNVSGNYSVHPTVFIIAGRISFNIYFACCIYFIGRRYVWFSILLAVTVEVIINWVNFCYYESRGLMILFTFVQIAVMAILILILKAIGSKAEG